MIVAVFIPIIYTTLLPNKHNRVNKGKTSYAMLYMSLGIYVGCVSANLSSLLLLIYLQR